LDLNSATDDELKSYADKEHVRYEKNQGRGRLIDLIYKKKVRPLLIQPCFLINPPVEIEPLAKKDPANPKEVQRLQILAGGTELGKGFSELNDPLDQRARFEEQMKLREAGDPEAQMIDHDYLEAMEYGMPPMAGFGLSERVFSVIMDKSIRETNFFPLMKHE
jgi:lysyl-tRNA synthetase, class II